MSISYTFNHADGTTIGTIQDLEGNGPNASAVPIRISDVDFSTTPPSIVISGDLLSMFPAATIIRVPVSSIDPINRTLTVTGVFNDEQLTVGKPLAVGDSSTSQIEGFTITSVTTGATTTTIEVDADLSGLSGWANPWISSVRRFVLSDGVYDGAYFCAEAGASFDGVSQTKIPVHDNTPLPMPGFSIIAVTPGANGVFVVDSASAGCRILPGSTVSVLDNSLSAANTTYIVQQSECSASYHVVGLGTKAITIAGNVAKLMVNGKQISVSGGTLRDARLTIASVTTTGTETTINTMEQIPANATIGATLVCVPATTAITVGSIQPGVGADGQVVPAPPTELPFSAPPAVVPVADNNVLVTWRVSGDQSAKFSVGCPITIKGNSLFKFQNLTVDAVSVSNGMTHITTVWDRPTGSIELPDASGRIVTPASIATTGMFVRQVDGPMSPIKLIGKGSPSYNSQTTWGQALQENILHSVENFTTGVKTSILSMTTAGFVISNKYLNNIDLVAGRTLNYSGDSGTLAAATYVIASCTSVTNGLLVSVVGGTSPSHVGDGEVRVVGSAPANAMVGQLWYNAGVPQLMAYTESGVAHGIVVQTVPAIDVIDMGNNRIQNMADPLLNMDAVNLQTSDALYIAKAGGYDATGTSRSGTMTGSLNFGNRPAGATWSAIGINMNSANVSMYGSSSVVYDALSTGGVIINGAGNVDVANGRVRVGNGTSDYVTLQNHAGSAPTITFTTSTTDNAALNMGSNKIVNVSTPTAASDAANKAYVDGLSNGIVWLQPVLDPNLFRDDLNTPPFITTTVVGVSTGAANYWKISGNWASSFVAGQVLTITDNTLPAANGSYVVVSAANNGANTDVTVTASTIPVGAGTAGTATDTSVPTHKTYIVGSSPTGAWAGLARHAVVYTTTSIDPVTQVQTWGWLDILGRAVQVGDRFGVFVEPDAEDPLNILPAGGLVSSAGKIATITNVSPLTYSFYTPTEPYAFSVTGVSPTLNSNAGSTKSPHFGHSYTFRGTYGSGSYGSNYKWIEFAGPSMFAAGGGLKYAGSVLNVGAGAGIIVNSDTVQLDNTYASGIYVRLDGAYAMTGALKLGGNQINNVGTPTLSTDAANKLYADNQDALRVAKAGDSMSGTLTFTSGTVTGIAYPTANQDAASKVYVDNQAALRVAKTGDTMSGSLVMTGAGVGITLPNAPVVATDAVNKTYADSKLSLSGGTMIGTLTLSANPVGNLDAAPKQYVDNGFVKVTASTSMNAAVNVTFTGGGEVLGLPNTPSAGSAATSKTYVDTQLASKATDTAVVHMAGNETINGDKTFNGVTTVKNNTIISANGVNNNLAITASAVSLVGTPVNSGGASNITIIGGVNTGGIGGSVSLTGGNGSTIGGDITITGGQGSAGQGGNVTITTGIGSTTPGQLTLTAGSASLQLQTTGVWRVGGLAPTAKSQALCADAVNPTTASPTWQLVGTRVAAAPANSAAPGVIGNWFADDSYFYVYGATGWRRIATTTF